MQEVAQTIVVGAGPAGSATAAALAHRGIETILLDKASFPRDKTCGDGLTPRAVAALDKMELLPLLKTTGALRIEGTRIYAPNGTFIEVGFDELKGDLPGFGLTIPRRRLDAMLLEHAIAAGAHFISGFKVNGFMRKDGAIRGVEGKFNGKPAAIHAPLTCLATGTSMPLVRAAGLLPIVPPVIRATRSYFEQVDRLEPFFQLHFDRHLLPGYGWIFPLNGGRANVGAGRFPGRQFRNRVLPSDQLFHRFVHQNPDVRRQLAGASAAEPAKSYPLRTDFLSVKTQCDGLLLVGEAAGLVNPINGEGVDMALESGLMAAGIAAKALSAGDLSEGRLSEYGQALHEQYHTFFRYLIRMRAWYIQERVLNLIIGKAHRKPRLKYLFVNAALGLVDPKDAVSWRTLREIIF